MPFLLPNQQRRSTEGELFVLKWLQFYHVTVRGGAGSVQSSGPKRQVQQHRQGAYPSRSPRWNSGAEQPGMLPCQRLLQLDDRLRQWFSAVSLISLQHRHFSGKPGNVREFWQLSGKNYMRENCPLPASNLSVFNGLFQLFVVILKVVFSLLGH